MASRGDQSAYLTYGYLRSDFLLRPLDAPERINARDFLRFIVPAGFPADKYDVVIQTNSTSIPTINIGKLSQSVGMPDVILGSTVTVVPRDGRGPSFIGRLDNWRRNRTYEIPAGIPAGGNQIFTMKDYA